MQLLKDAVKFHDPVNRRREKIPITKEMRKSVRLARSAYKARLDQEKEEKKKELEGNKRKKEEKERGRSKTEKREGEVVEVQRFFGKERGEFFKG